MLTGTTLMGLRRETRPARRTDEDRGALRHRHFCCLCAHPPSPLARAYSDARAHPLRRVVQGGRAGRQRVAAALQVVYLSSRERCLHNDALRRRPSRRGALRPASPSPSRQSTPLRHPTPWRLRRSPEAHPRLPCALGRHRAMCVLYTKGCIATPADARPKLSPQLGIESAVSSGIKKAGACMITMTPRAGLVFLVWRTVLLSRRLDLLRCYLLPL